MKVYIVQMESKGKTDKRGERYGKGYSDEMA